MGGSLVANVQAKAAANGVLTPSLKSMLAMIPAPNTQQAVKLVRVPILRRPPTTTQPTQSPTNSPTRFPTRLPLAEVEYKTPDPTPPPSTNVLSTRNSGGEPETSRGGDSVSDKLSDFAKDSTEGLTTAELAAVGLSAACAVAGLIFAYLRYKKELKKIKLQEDNAMIDRGRLKKQALAVELEYEGRKLENVKRRMELEALKKVYIPDDKECYPKQAVELSKLEDKLGKIDGGSGD